MENKTEEKVENKNAKDTWIWMVAIVIITYIWFRTNMLTPKFMGIFNVFKHTLTTMMLA